MLKDKHKQNVCFGICGSFFIDIIMMSVFNGYLVFTLMLQDITCY